MFMSYAVKAQKKNTMLVPVAEFCYLRISTFSYEKARTWSFFASALSPPLPTSAYRYACKLCTNAVRRMKYLHVPYISQAISPCFWCTKYWVTFTARGRHEWEYGRQYIDIPFSEFSCHTVYACMLRGKICWAPKGSFHAQPMGSLHGGNQVLRF